ncbi:6-carboxytetrahydropterin synthase [bacterium]|nr:6-carboxytetrahydropterin synthase [bacterium]
MGRYVITIAKEYLKFSSAHFTIFDDNSVELLHGHNYYVTLQVFCRDTDNGIIIEFKQLKKIAQTVCDQLDEKILLPAESPFLKVAKDGDAFDVTFHGTGFSKHYRFPCEDIELLPVSNITSELLAKYLNGEIIKKLESLWKSLHHGNEIFESVNSVGVTVEETRGQSVTYIWDF